jgi:hypothetical protein
VWMEEGETFADDEQEILRVAHSSCGNISSHISSSNYHSRAGVCCGIRGRVAIIVHQQLWGDSTVHLGW